MKSKKPLAEKPSVSQVKGSLMQEVKDNGLKQGFVSELVKNKPLNGNFSPFSNESTLLNFLQKTKYSPHLNDNLQKSQLIAPTGHEI